MHRGREATGKGQREDGKPCENIILYRFMEKYGTEGGWLNGQDNAEGRNTVRRRQMMRNPREE